MQPKRTTPIRRRGLHVVGRGFYLWDLDPREALCLAAELQRRPVPSSAAQQRNRRPAATGGR